MFIDRKFMYPQVKDRFYSEQMLVSLRKIIRAVDLHSKQLIKSVGITTPQYMVLKCIVEHPHSTVGQIAKHSSLSQATTTPIIDKLVAKQYVVREKHQFDKRKSLLCPTDDGIKIISQSPSPLQETFLEHFSLLHEWEKSNLLSSLQRIAHMMQADSITAEPVLTDDELAQR